MTYLHTDSTRRWLSAALGAAALLSAAVWLQILVSPAHAPAPASTATSAAPPRPMAGSVNELALVLGAPPGATAGAAPGLAQRFRLWGVMASASGQGAALLSLDDQPPRTFSVGAEVAPGLVLQAVGPREAMLAASLQGPVILTLQVPDLPAGSGAAPSAPAGLGDEAATAPVPVPDARPASDPPVRSSRSGEPR